MIETAGCTVADALRAAARALASTSDTARLDAELLMAKALDVSRSDLLLRHMDQPCPAGFDALIERRAMHEPVAYILGEAEFYGRSFAVDPAVLIPRGDSECVVAAALDHCSQDVRVLDMGTGSGALLLTILAERAGTRGLGIDVSPEALLVAASNTKRLGLEGRAEMQQRDWRNSDWTTGLGAFDLIVCNPPYVEQAADLDPDVRDFEPSLALFAGPDGLDDYRVIIPQLRDILAENGAAVLEIGANQGESVAEIARKAGFSAQLVHDLAHRPRALVLR